MSKISIHPIFVFFALALAISGKSVVLLNTIVCCTLHELGHVRAAAVRGYRLNSMVFMPYGAMVTGGETIHPKDEAAISLWGPAVNLILFAAVAALWWIFPETYSFTKGFACQNLAIALFNLLPFYPLDLSRILLARSKNRLKTLSILRAAGVAAATAFFVLFAISLFFHPNFSLLLSSLMFLSGSLFGVKSEVKMYNFNTAYCKDYRHPVEKKFYRVSVDLPLSRVLRLLSPTAELTVEIVSPDGKTLATLSERELVDRVSRAPAGATVRALVAERY